MVAEIIAERILDSVKAKIKIFPCHVNRASSCGHPCERFLFYSRAKWNERALHDVSLQLIFDEGNIHEESVLSRLKSSGIEVVEQQRSFEWKELELTGHIDCSIIWEGKSYPAEIKSMSPHTFDTVNSVEDMVNGKYVYLRGYPSQMYMYLLMKGLETGLFILKNKVNGKIKIIEVPLDFEAAEKILKKLERVNKALKEKKEPERIEDADICIDCAFKHICLPPLQFSGDVGVGSGELVRLLEEKERLEAETEPFKSVEHRLKAVTDEIKKLTEGHESVIAGNFYLTGKWVERAAFTAKPSMYWSVKIATIK